MHFHDNFKLNSRLFSQAISSFHLWNVQWTFFYEQQLSCFIIRRNRIILV